jgi:hypothetical protein
MTDNDVCKAEVEASIARRLETRLGALRRQDFKSVFRTAYAAGASGA